MLNNKYNIITVLILVVVFIAIISFPLQQDGLVGGQVRTSNNINFGTAINSGVNNTVLYTTGATALGSESAFSYNATSNLLSLTGGSVAVGSSTASGSSVYAAEFVSSATTSINFTGTSINKGTCLQMKNTLGVPVYVRIVGTILTVTQVSCHP